MSSSAIPSMNRSSSSPAALRLRRAAGVGRLGGRRTLPGARSMPSALPSCPFCCRRRHVRWGRGIVDHPLVHEGQKFAAGIDSRIRKVGHLLAVQRRLRRGPAVSLASRVEFGRVAELPTGVPKSAHSRCVQRRTAWIGRRRTSARRSVRQAGKAPIAWKVGAAATSRRLPSHAAFTTCRSGSTCAHERRAALPGPAAE